jgi:hypothetical protein
MSPRRPSQPIDVEGDLIADYKFKLAQLDEAHKRARTPFQRKDIEERIRETHREIQGLIILGKNVDQAFEKWVASLNLPKGTA